MRKVFLWNVLLSKDDKPVHYTSEDFELPKSEWKFGCSYLIEMNVEENDTILVLSALTEGEQAQDNYLIFKEEVNKIVAAKHAAVLFEEIIQPSEFDDPHTCLRFFKAVSAKLKDGDRIYYDMTSGMKPYSFSMFIALAYAAKAARDISVEQLVYVSLYSGKTKDNNDAKPSIATIWDVTSLFTLNEIAGNVLPGQKASSDQMLDCIIGDED